MIDRLAIYLLLAGCLIFGAIVFIELQPATGDEPALSARTTQPQDPTSAVPRQPSTRFDELLTTVMARPLFSSTRRPPQSVASDGPSSADLGDTRLTGIVTEPGHHLAIFAVNGGKPLRLTEGEDLSGWRIESITPREVSLSGPGGTKTLEPKIDPSLAQGPPPSPAPVPNAAGRVPPQIPAAVITMPRPVGPQGLPGPPLRPSRAGTRP
jgi:general secretion pathway protein N